MTERAWSSQSRGGRLETTRQGPLEQKKKEIRASANEKTTKKEGGKLGKKAALTQQIEGDGERGWRNASLTEEKKGGEKKSE